MGQEVHDRVGSPSCTRYPSKHCMVQWCISGERQEINAWSMHFKNGWVICHCFKSKINVDGLPHKQLNNLLSFLSSIYSILISKGKIIGSLNYVSKIKLCLRDLKCCFIF